MTKLSHIDLNVSQYAKSIRFYDMVLIPLDGSELFADNIGRTTRMAP